MNILAISRHLCFLVLTIPSISWQIFPYWSEWYYEIQGNLWGIFWYFEDLACFEDQSNQEHEIKQKQLSSKSIQNCLADMIEIILLLPISIKSSYFLIESFLSKSPQKRVGPAYSIKTKLNFACRPTVYLYVFSYSKDLSLFHFLKSGNCRDGKECFTRWNNESKW